ncbi:hypothetical protein [Micromonospora sp. B9E7]|uniref:hypothetical protein n=1 Tax=Micromonospora sp. B9E7 TaxID=3153574 RepID=UPI00325F431B
MASWLLQSRAVGKHLTDACQAGLYAVASAIAHAIAQPDAVDVNEIIMRSTAQG